MRNLPVFTAFCRMFLIIAAGVMLLPSAVSAIDIDRDFAHPPDSARPWVYWFWLNGNITREGITADLEAMQRAGIGGVLIMEVDQGVPLGPVSFMSAEWRELFHHVVVEADRLGLEVNMNNDAGWNGSGGPWITPEQSMQKVVFTATDLEGPAHFEGALPQPEAVAGFYRDIRVLAFPAPGDFRIDSIAVKACYQTGGVGSAAETQLPPEMVIDRARILDLSEAMTPDGRLAWDTPPGKWTVMRFGHTSTGVENAPSPASGRGLECDKLSREGIEAQFAGMMGPLIADAGPLAGKTLVATHIDSWENGAQNWTARMREEFQQRRGYDLLSFLPVFSGRVVDSVEISERFLYDLRRTISDLIEENYAGRLRELAAEHDMRLTIEAYGGPCDDMPYAAQCDEPMGEFWIGGGALSTCKEMASAGHTSGKNIIGAESFTAGDQERWLMHPATIKALGDTAFCAGINRFVFHRYALQPWRDRRPGMTMGPWGIHYERTQTWWEMSRPWNEYLARCQFMLRQGHFVADICYLQPETAPQGYSDHKKNGYDFDNCSAETVVNDMTVRDGRLELPDGMRYSVLVLPDVRAMTSALLRKITELVETGATVIGPRPLKSPSLTDYPACDEEVRQMAEALWGPCDGQAVQEHAFGQGRIVWGPTPEQWLAKSGVGPAFVTRSRLNWIHRSTPEECGIYFIANPHRYPVRETCRFREYPGEPMFWDPLTGERMLAPIMKDWTAIPLNLEPGGSVFVVYGTYDPPNDRIAALSRDGKTVLSAFDTGPQVRVQRAIYGLLEDPARTRDVRELVQRLIDEGQESFPVRMMAQSGDPANGALKTLQVDYEIDGRACTVRGTDEDSVRLAGAPHITVHKARYGVLDDPQRTRDVTAKLQHLLDTGETTFDVAWMARGDDPAFLVVKTLEAECEIAGTSVPVRGIDPDTLTVALDPNTEELPANARITGDGLVYIEAWQPGRYTTTRVNGKTHDIIIDSVPEPVTLDGPWNLTFPAGWGAPEHATLDHLVSWSEHEDPGIRYFSGTAEYTIKLNVPENLFGADKRLYLDLGEVQVMAHATLNGQDLGVLWKPPYRIEVTGLVAQGENTLEVAVANLWINRMIGDEQLPEDSRRRPEGTLEEWPDWLNADAPSPTGRYTFTTWRLWKKDAPLQRSGLIGPVRLRTTVSVPVPFQ